MKIINLKKEYPLRRGNKVIALDGLDFELPSRGMVFVLGRSGSGKTTLLNMLAGLDTPTSGSIIFRGRDIAAMTESERDNYRNTYCGFIFQDYNLLPELTVGDNIALAAEMQGKKCRAEEVESVLSSVGLGGLSGRNVRSLSGGQRQRVAIARAIIKDPEIIFADEPTGALDSATGESTMSLLKKLSRSRLVIVITHERDYALKYGDMTIEISDGKICSVSGDVRGNEEERPFCRAKGAIPLKKAAAISLVNVRKHPLRFIVTVIITVIAFVFFCVPVDVSLWDDRVEYLNAVRQFGVEYTTINKVRSVDGDGFESLDQLFGGNAGTTETIDMSEEDFALIQSVCGSPLVRENEYESYNIQQLAYKFQERKDEFSAMQRSAEDCYAIQTEGVVSIAEDAFDYYGLKIIAGSFPCAEDEIMISECLYNTYSFFGLTDRDGKVYHLSSPEDIVGHYYDVGNGIPQWKKITGVVDTGCEGYGDHGIINCRSIFHEKIYVAPQFMPLSECSLYYFTPDDESAFMAVMDIIFTSQDNKAANGNEYFSITNDYSAVLGLADGGDVTVITTAVLYVGIIAFVLAFAFLVNYIMMSIRRQLKQIGILSAMGADTKCLLKIYGAMTAFICVISFILSCALYVAVGLAYNGMMSDMYGFGVHICSFNPLVFAILLSALALVALFGCVIPVLRYRRDPPATIINRGLIR